MTSPTGVERRRRLSTTEVAEQLARHEKECADRYGTILGEIRGMREEVRPVLEIWQAGGVAVRLIKLIALLATAVTAVWAAIRLWPK